MTTTTSVKFANAADLVLAVSRNNIGDMESILNNDLTILSTYYRKWRLTANSNKTGCICFHLNKDPAHQLNIQFDGHPVKHNSTTKYLGVTLDILTLRKNSSDSPHEKQYPEGMRYDGDGGMHRLNSAVYNSA